MRKRAQEREEQHTDGRESSNTRCGFTNKDKQTNGRSSTKASSHVLFTRDLINVTAKVAAPFWPSFHISCTLRPINASYLFEKISQEVARKLLPLHPPINLFISKGGVFVKWSTAMIFVALDILWMPPGVCYLLFFVLVLKW